MPRRLPDPGRRDGGGPLPRPTPATASSPRAWERSTPRRARPRASWSTSAASRARRTRPPSRSPSIRVALPELAVEPGTREGPVVSGRSNVRFRARTRSPPSPCRGRSASPRDERTEVGCGRGAREPRPKRRARHWVPPRRSARRRAECAPIRRPACRSPSRGRDRPGRAASCWQRPR